MPRNLIISTDKLNSAQICPRYYYYSHILAKTSLLKPDYFQVGSVIHESLKLYYTKLMNKERVDRNVIEELTRNFAAKDPGISLPPDKVEETLADFNMYLDFYEAQGSSWNILGVEEPFAKVLYEGNDLRIVVNGKSDLRVHTNHGKGPIAVIDHKYESRFNKKPDRDNQPLCYAWAWDTYDFIYNRIGKQKSYKPEKRLLREWISYGQHQIDEWIDTAIYTCLELVRFNELEMWPVRYSGCNIHGNRCTFYDVCNTTPDNREYKLNSIFGDKASFKLMEDS